MKLHFELAPKFQLGSYKFEALASRMGSWSFQGCVPKPELGSEGSIFYKAKPMPRSRYRFLSKTSPHFMTATVNRWQPLFTRTETVDIVLDSWRFLQREAGFEIYGYVILENHLHLIAASDDLSRDMQRFKSYTAKRIIELLEQRQAANVLSLLALFKRAHKTESTYQVWEEGNHPQMIESEVVMRQKLDYIHLNPVKRGYVDLPEHWRYSSARNYAGQDGLIEVVKAW